MAPSIQLRPGLLDRLKKYSGLETDQALAGAIGVSPDTLMRVRAGKQSPSAQFLVGVSSAFGLSLGEVAQVVSEAEAATKKKVA